MTPGRKCKVSWCKEIHGLADCPLFLGFSRARRYLACMRHSVCTGCLSPEHWDLPDKPACRLGGAVCGKCKDWHHELLMCPVSAPKSSEELEVWEQTGKVSVNAANGDGQPNPVQMLAQRIGVGDSGLELNAFWDSGAQLTMIAHARAAECGLRRRRAPPLEVVAFDGGATLVDTGYHVPLVLVDGGVYTVFAYGVDEIATDLRHTLKDSSVLADFPEVTWEQVEGLSGQVELLIGMDNCRVFPAERSRKNSVALWASQFGTGWMLAGTTAASCACSECKCALPTRAAAAAAMFRPPILSLRRQWARRHRLDVLRAGAARSASSWRRR